MWCQRHAGAWRWLPTPSSAEVKERAKMYLYSPSGPSWPVLGWTLLDTVPSIVVDFGEAYFKITCGRFWWDTLYHYEWWILVRHTLTLGVVDFGKPYFSITCDMFTRKIISYLRREEKPTRCHWMVYCTYNMLNMFRSLLCPSSGARNYTCVITAYGARCLGYWLLEVRCRTAG